MTPADLGREVLTRLAEVSATAQALHNGDPGFALAFGRLHELEPDAGWDAVAHRYVERAVRSVSAEGVAGIGLLDGLAGVAFTVRSLSAGGRRYGTVLGRLDTALATLIQRHLENLPEAGGVAFADFDVVSGLTGAAAYLLAVPGAEPVLNAVLERFTRWTKAGPGEGFWTPPSRLHPLEGDHNADGYLNLGLAHGIPGPLALFALARRAGADVDPAAAGALAERLIETVAHTGYGPDVPGLLPLGPRTRPFGTPNRFAWCYGNAGAARALQLAGDAFAEPVWTAHALALLRSGLARPPHVARCSAPGLCHGIAGNLRVVTRVAADAGTPADLAESRTSLLDNLIAAYDPSAVYGYRDLPPDSPPADDPGFLVGAAGVALTLLSVDAPDVTWDRALLLA